ncbi:putative glycosyl transferase family protein [Listeria weihenstephanensis FSL R9-0317]|uniref:glycosyltransferase n=1 Tax=Listeria weihenstephanensis TaxID=1006155 RepID=UPI0003E87E0D|nr:glycosyltransferase [Listeria weihenstephanensis]EUJ40096.1 putative glycosyl transferase family protein [Listeria weihenstephanensis FSL R9-0317]
MPSISIVLPVYNVAPYLKACLDSLYLQSFRDFEVIAVNDGSSDDSLAILEAYGAFLPELQIISQTNQGLSAARNTGLQYVTGKYVYFLDSDDYLQEDTLETCYTLAELDQIDLIKFDAEPFTEDNITITNSYDSRQWLQENKIYSQKEWLRAQQKHFNSPVWLYFVRTELLMKHQLRFVDGILHEDEIFTPQLFTKATSFKYIAQPFFKRRYRTGSIMQNNIYQSQASYDSKLRIVQMLDQESKNATSEEAKQFLEQRRNTLYMDSRGYNEALRKASPLPILLSKRLELRAGIRYIRKGWKR